MRRTLRWLPVLGTTLALVTTSFGTAGAHASTSPPSPPVATSVPTSQPSTSPPPTTGAPTTGTATTTATPSVTGTPPLCGDPAAAPAGARAYASLLPPANITVRLSWTAPVLPAGCPAWNVEIEQVSPSGGTRTVPAATGGVTLPPLATLTAYTWRLRFVSGTVSEWATVSVARILPLDYCLALPPGRAITARAESPTTLRLEWGVVSYPEECSGSVTVRNVTTGATVATVSRTQTGVTLTGLTPGSTSTWVVLFFIQLGPAVTVTQPEEVAPSCAASVRVDSAWNSGLVATVTVRNTSAQPLSSWSARWAVPAGVGVSSVWNASGTTQQGVFTARSASWNSSLAPGASRTFGFVASRTGAAPVVPEFTCTGPAAR